MKQILFFILLPFLGFSQSRGYVLENSSGEMEKPVQESLDRWWFSSSRNATADVVHDIKLKTSQANNIGFWNMDFGTESDATEVMDSVLFAWDNYQIRLRASDRIILRGLSGLNPEIILDKTNERITLNEAGGDIHVKTLTEENQPAYLVTMGDVSDGQLFYTVNPFETGTAFMPDDDDLSNLDALTFGEAQWVRINNVVTVSGVFYADPTSTGSASFKMTTPVTSDIGSDAQYGCGTAVAPDYGDAAGIVAGGTGIVVVSWIASSTVSTIFSYHYTYQIR